MSQPEPLPCPIGVVWRTGFVRCCSDCFDKPYLISEMKRSPKNIEPVAVLDIITKKCTVYMINLAMTDFDIVSDPILARRVEGIADYFINKKNIQKSNLTIDEKSGACDLNVLKHQRGFALTAENQAEFKRLMKKGQLVESE